MYRHASLDIAIATEHQGKGLGPEALRLAIGYLIEERGHHRFTIDPSAANERAISAYARLGFKPVGVMRRYERHADGEWHDGAADGPAGRRARVASRRPWTGKPRGCSKDSRTSRRARPGASCSTTSTTRRAAASRSCARRWRRTGSCCCRSSASCPATRPTASARSPRSPGSSSSSLVEFRQALGLAVPDPDAEVLTEVDLETAKDAAALAEAGFPFDDTLEVTRVLGRGMVALRGGAARAVRPDLPRARRLEVELARRLESAAGRAAAAVEPHARPRLPPAHAPAAAQRLHRARRADRPARSPTPRTRRSRSPTSSASPSWGRPSASRSSAASRAGSRSSRAASSSRRCGSSSRSATR